MPLNARHLITGAAGFLGKALCAHLGANVPGAELHSCGRSEVSADGVLHHPTDLTDGHATRALIAKLKPDYVYHLAGISRVSNEISLPEYFRSNALTTQNLVEALAAEKRPARIFLGSSVHVYGNRVERVKESEEVHPASPYAFSKHLAEQILFDVVMKTPELSAVIGRLYSCFGPGQRPGFVTADLTAKIRKLPTDGSGTLQVGALDSFRSFLDVRDAVQLLARLMEVKLETRFEVFNLASANEYTIQQVLDSLLQISGRKAKIVSQDSGSNTLKGLRVDLEKLHRALPGLRFRPLGDTLRDMWESSS